MQLGVGEIGVAKYALPAAMRAKYAGIATQVTLPASPRSPEDAERLAEGVRGLQEIRVVE